MRCTRRDRRCHPAPATRHNLRALGVPGTQRTVDCAVQAHACCALSRTHTALCLQRTVFRAPASCMSSGTHTHTLTLTSTLPQLQERVEFLLLRLALLLLLQPIHTRACEVTAQRTEAHAAAAAERTFFRGTAGGGGCRGAALPSAVAALAPASRPPPAPADAPACAGRATRGGPSVRGASDLPSPLPSCASPWPTTPTGTKLLVRCATVAAHIPTSQRKGCSEVGIRAEVVRAGRGTCDGRVEQICKLALAARGRRHHQRQPLADN